MNSFSSTSLALPHTYDIVHTKSKGYMLRKEGAVNTWRLECMTVQIMQIMEIGDKYVKIVMRAIETFSSQIDWLLNVSTVTLHGICTP